MIPKETLSAIGIITKIHGTNGEVNTLLNVSPDYLDETDYIIMEMDGIPVPFRIESVRTRGNAGALIRFEDIDSAIEAKPFSGKTIYTDKTSLREYMMQEEGVDEGEFADELIGYTIVTQHGTIIGRITDIDLSTENALFILENAREEQIFIPIVDEFISDMIHDEKKLIMNLPDGLIELNK